MPPRNPKIGFVSLGCPKALVDSERILTQLRVEGYQVVPSYSEADVVVVNTCGFIDSAVAESLDAIGEAMAENGKVIVTGCLGKREEVIRQAHPGVLSISGPQDYGSVMGAVHAALFWVSVSFLTPLILLVTLFNARHRTLHDIVLGTVVINNAARADALRRR